MSITNGVAITDEQGNIILSAHIQVLRGNLEDMDPFKMLAGEFAVTTDGTKKVYVAFAPDDVAELLKTEDVDSELSTESVNPIQNKVVAEKMEELSKEYTWEKYTALANGEYNLVYSDGEIQSSAANTTAPSSRILYKTLTLDSTTGQITLSEPLSETQSTATEIYENYASYPYYYGDYSDGSTNGTIYKYKSMSRTISEGSYVTLTFWKWNSQKVSAEPESYEKGDFVETIYSDNEEDYPDDGVQDGYWYVRKKTKATLVSFDATGTQLTADTVQRALVELANMIASGDTGGSGGTAKEIELQKSDTAIQWRYVGDEEWTDLVLLEELKGEKGDTGATGATGADGADGTSVTITSVTESTEDGSENVVEFSDGNSLTVKNGSKGDTGKTAYEYAQDGGYTGTEEEFAAKLAEEIAIDTELSETSTNPVQNKIVTEKFNELSNKIDTVQTELGSYIEEVASLIGGDA